MTQKYWCTTLIDLSQTVVALDLDDTLYPEAAYRASGLREVCIWVKALYGKSVSPEIASQHASEDADPLAEICHAAGLPMSVKESLLWIYRLHAPDLTLTAEVSDCVNTLVVQCKAVVILTDGRSISQRQKLKALGLSHLPAYISDDHDSVKPDLLRFNLIMRDYPAQRYVYLGDNPKKDFLAPNALSWLTIGLRGDATNIHSQDVSGLPIENLPTKWISSMKELKASLC